MSISTLTRPPPRDRQRGAALVVALIAMVALLGVGAITMLTVRSDSAALGQERFNQVAMYAAESGAAMAMEFLRGQCDASQLYSQYVEPNNVDPQSPPQIPGNNVQPGENGNPFEVPDTWYQVTILNNPDDAKLAEGVDGDGVIVLRVVGHGPGASSATVEVELASPTDCMEEFCQFAYAQENVNAQNDTVAACFQSIDVSQGLNVVGLGGS